MSKLLLHRGVSLLTGIAQCERVKGVVSHLKCYRMRMLVNTIATPPLVSSTPMVLSQHLTIMVGVTAAPC